MLLITIGWLNLAGSLLFAGAVVLDWLSPAGKGEAELQEQEEWDEDEEHESPPSPGENYADKVEDMFSDLEE
jgi:hypothetical protein